MVETTVWGHYYIHVAVVDFQQNSCMTKSEQMSHWEAHASIIGKPILYLTCTMLGLLLLM